MNEALNRVVRDIQETMEYDVCRVRNAVSGRRAAVKHLTDGMCLGMPPGVIHSARYPLRPDLLRRLEEELHEHPQWRDAEDYPENILCWIEEHLHSWDQGDVLGRYLPVDRAIEFYWLSIVLTARRHRWEAADLAFVVFIHEWVHAFTHLGRDSEGRDWPLPHFVLACKKRSDLIEGLAQYYTHYMLHDASVPKRDQRIAVFLGLMKHQPPAYRRHMAWLENVALDLYRKHGIAPAQGDDTPEDLLMAPVQETVRSVMRAKRRDINTCSFETFTKELGLQGIAIDQVVNLF